MTLQEYQKQYRINPDIFKKIYPDNIKRENNVWIKTCKTCGNIHSFVSYHSSKTLGDKCVICKTIKGVCYNVINKKYERKCPQCNNILSYINKYTATELFKKNSVCNSCANRINIKNRKCGPYKSLPEWIIYNNITKEYTITYPCCGKVVVRNKIQSLQRKNNIKCIKCATNNVNRPQTLDWIKARFIARYKKKEYIFPSGKRTVIQGYEDRGIDYLLTKYNIKEDDIVTSSEKECPIIEYTFNGRTHNYFPDIFIKSTNTIVEIKSIYTHKAQKEKNLAKISTAFNIGYNILYIVFKKSKKTSPEIIIKNH
jgi:hypothetical protein